MLENVDVNNIDVVWWLGTFVFSASGFLIYLFIVPGFYDICGEETC